MPAGVMMMSLQKVIVAHTASLPNTACTRPFDRLRDRWWESARFQAFVWLGVGSVKMALSRPTHQYPEGAYPQGAAQTPAVGRFH